MQREIPLLSIQPLSSSLRRSLITSYSNNFYQLNPQASSHSSSRPSFPLSTPLQLERVFWKKIRTRAAAPIAVLSVSIISKVKHKGCSWCICWAEGGEAFLFYCCFFKHQKDGIGGSKNRGCCWQVAIEEVGGRQKRGQGGLGEAIRSNQCSRHKTSYSI